MLGEGEVIAVEEIARVGQWAAFGDTTSNACAAPIAAGTLDSAR